MIKAEDKADEIGMATRELVEKYLREWSKFVPNQEFLGRMKVFAAELARWGAKINLTAAPGDPSELAAHILDSLMPLLLARHDPSGGLALALAKGQRILDLGSGAGFPGLVLAATTEAEFRLVESRRKRVSFLRTAIGAMGLSNVEVDSQYPRAFAPEFDVVTARAFAQPEKFYEVAATALKPGGITMLYASERQREEIEKILLARHEIAMFHDYEPQRMTAGPGGKESASPRHLIVVSRKAV
jgi:16S rRNA (guanine527-N7)-methyltransferase